MKPIISPLFIRLAKSDKGKKYHLNLNQYRNWYYTTNNNIKKKYKELITDQIKDFKFEGKISLTYTLFRGTKRKGDKMNVLCIHDKFFCDALVELGCIEDDNDEYIVEHVFKLGGYDKNNGRVEITIEEV